MKSVWVYASAPDSGSWLDALAPSLAEAGIERHVLHTEAWQGDDGAMRSALNEAAERGGCLLCLTAANDPLLSDINRACHAVALPLLLLSPAADSWQIGPGVVFGTSPCLACFENHERYLPLDNGSGPSHAEALTPAADAPALSGLMLEELVDFVTASPSGVLRRGYVIRAGSRGGTALRFRVLKNPTCMVCSVFADHPTESLLIDN